MNPFRKSEIFKFLGTSNPSIIVLPSESASYTCKSILSTPSYTANMYPDFIKISGSPHFGKGASVCDWPSFVRLFETCVLDLGMVILITMYRYYFLKNFADKHHCTNRL